MTVPQFTIDDLRRILVEAAGVAEGPAIAAATADATFEELGYESLAVLETAGRIERELGITLGDSEVMESRTPRELVAVVNAHVGNLSA